MTTATRNGSARLTAKGDAEAGGQQRSGNASAQNMASGSRMNSRKRSSVSCTQRMPSPTEPCVTHRAGAFPSAPRTRPRAWRSAFGARSAAVRLRASSREQRGHGAVELGDLRRCTRPSTGATSPTRLAARRWPSRSTSPIDGELDDVLDADRGDQLARRAARDDLAVIHDRHAIAELLALRPCSAW